MSVGFENSPLLYFDMSGHSYPKGVVLSKENCYHWSANNWAVICLAPSGTIYLLDEQGVVDQRSVLVELQTIGWTKQGWKCIKIAKMANGHCCVPLCNKNSYYNTCKDLSCFNFPRNKEK